MQLLLMRHAEAEPIEAGPYSSDDLRPLTQHGRRTQKKVALALERLAIKPNRIITSPRLRAVQTATITAEHLRLESVLMERDALGPAYSFNAVLDMLRSFGNETLLCVGHDPDLCELGSGLLGLAKTTGIKFPKSAVMGIEFRTRPDVGEGILRFFYRPRDLLSLFENSGES